MSTRMFKYTLGGSPVKDICLFKETIISIWQDTRDITTFIAVSRRNGSEWNFHPLELFSLWPPFVYVFSGNISESIWLGFMNASLYQSAADGWWSARLQQCSLHLGTTLAPRQQQVDGTTHPWSLIDALSVPVLGSLFTNRQVGLRPWI